MKIEDLKKLGVSEDAANEIIAMTEKVLSDKEAELEMASEKIGELSEANIEMADKIKELSEEISLLKSKNDKLMNDRQLNDEDSRTVNMGLKHGAAASGEKFGFRFTGIRDARRA